MLMPMMGIGEMAVGVLEDLVHMDVRVGLLAPIVARMGVLVVLVMNVRVIMFRRQMPMPMRVLFAQMQPHPRRHEQSGDPQAAGQRRARATARAAPTKGATEK